MNSEPDDINFNTPPGITTVARISDINEVNNRLQNFRWILLGIVYKRKTESDGSFNDEESYIIGMRR